MWEILQDKWSNFNMKNDTKVGGVCNLQVKKDLRDIATKCNERLSFGSLFG